MPTNNDNTIDFSDLFDLKSGSNSTNNQNSNETLSNNFKISDDILFDLFSPTEMEKTDIFFGNTDKPDKTDSNYIIDNKDLINYYEDMANLTPGGDDIDFSSSFIGEPINQDQIINNNNIELSKQSNIQINTTEYPTNTLYNEKNDPQEEQLSISIYTLRFIIILRCPNENIRDHFLLALSKSELTTVDKIKKKLGKFLQENLYTKIKLATCKYSEELRKHLESRVLEEVNNCPTNFHLYLLADPNFAELLMLKTSTVSSKVLLANSKYQGFKNNPLIEIIEMYKKHKDSLRTPKYIINLFRTSLRILHQSKCYSVLDNDSLKRLHRIIIETATFAIKHKYMSLMYEISNKDFSSIHPPEISKELTKNNINQPLMKYFYPKDKSKKAFFEYLKLITRLISTGFVSSVCQESLNKLWDKIDLTAKNKKYFEKIQSIIRNLTKDGKLQYKHVNNMHFIRYLYITAKVNFEYNNSTAIDYLLRAEIIPKEFLTTKLNQLISKYKDTDYLDESDLNKSITELFKENKIYDYVHNILDNYLSGNLTNKNKSNNYNTSTESNNDYSISDEEHNQLLVNGGIDLEDEDNNKVFSSIEKELKDWGIDKKYFGIILSKIYPGSYFKNERIKFNNHLEFQQILNYPLVKTTFTTYKAHSSIAQFDIAVNSKKNLPSHKDNVIYIIAGRGQNAYIPKKEHLGKKDRILLVITEKQFNNDFQRDLPDYVDAIIIKSINAELFSENYSSIDEVNIKRFFILLSALHLKLNNYLNFDDNVARILANISNNIEDSDEKESKIKIEDIFNFISKNYDFNKFGAVSLQTEDVRKQNINGEGKGNFKACWVNFRKLLERTIDNIFSSKASVREQELALLNLVYPPKLSKHLLEEVWTIFYFNNILKLDFATVSQQFICYNRVRNKSIKNAVKKFLTTSNLRVTDLLKFDIKKSDYNKNIKEEKLEKIFNNASKVFSLIKIVIKQNELSYKKNKERYTKCSLLENHYHANKINIANISESVVLFDKNSNAQVKFINHIANKAPLDINKNTDILNIFRIIIKNMPKDLVKNAFGLRDYQVDAVLSLGRKDIYNILMMKLAPAAGKTRIQFVVTISFLIYQELIKQLVTAQDLNIKPHPIVITAPTRTLVDQAYNDFIRNLVPFIEAFKTTKLDLGYKSIAGVSSFKNRIGFEHIMHNDHLANTNCILIICKKTFTQLFDEYLDGEPKVVNLIQSCIKFLDESHLYPDLLKENLIEIAKKTGVLIPISATLQDYKHFYKPNVAIIAAEVSRQFLVNSGYSAPIILNKLNELDFQDNTEIEDYISDGSFIDFLKDNITPNNEDLIKSKGIVKFPNIKLAKQAHISLQKEGVKSFIVNSAVKNIDTEISKIRKEKSGIIIVVDMLGTGYSDPDLKFIVFFSKSRTSSDKKAQENYYQYLTRVGRILPSKPNKVGVGFGGTTIPHKLFGKPIDDKAIEYTDKEFKERYPDLFTNYKTKKLELEWKDEVDENNSHSNFNFESPTNIGYKSGFNNSSIDINNKELNLQYKSNSIRKRKLITNNFKQAKFKPDNLITTNYDSLKSNTNILIPNKIINSKHKLLAKDIFKKDLNRVVTDAIELSRFKQLFNNVAENRMILLFTAIEHGREKWVSFILEHIENKNLLLQDSLSRNSLHYAFKSKSICNSKILSLLLKKLSKESIDINLLLKQKDKQGFTPIDKAKQKGNEELLKQYFITNAKPEIEKRFTI